MTTLQREDEIPCKEKKHANSSKLMPDTTKVLKHFTTQATPRRPPVDLTTSVAVSPRDGISDIITPGYVGTYMYEPATLTSCSVCFVRDDFHTNLCINCSNEGLCRIRITRISQNYPATRLS